MFERVGIVESSGQGTLRVQATPTTASPQESSAAKDAAAPFSMRMTPDPSAGVMVMEYISEEGESTMQIPSRTVVAYLRSGLSEAGLPIPDETGSLNEEA